MRTMTGDKFKRGAHPKRQSHFAVVVVSEGHNKASNRDLKKNHYQLIRYITLFGLAPVSRNIIHVRWPTTST